MIGESFEPKYRKGDRIKLAGGTILEVKSDPIWDECWHEWTYDTGGAAMPCECWLAENGATRIE